MTKERYVRMTERMREITARLPTGAGALRWPTYLCALIYIGTLFRLMQLRDVRLVRALCVPAACFAAVTALRPLIGKQRPYDRYGVPPVGEYLPGKGKSMPSRHTASAAAIAIAVAWVYPTWPAALAMAALCALIASLRVLGGQHDVGDVVAAVALSVAISMIGYGWL